PGRSAGCRTRSWPVIELRGCTRKRLTSAKATMKPSTSTAASRSQRLGSRRRPSIEMGGRIFISGTGSAARKSVERFSVRPRDQTKNRVETIGVCGCGPRKEGRGGRQPHLPVFAKAKIARQFRAVCRGGGVARRLFVFVVNL